MTTVTVPRRRLHDFVDGSAERAPDRLAWRSPGGAALDYGTLAARSGRFAATLGRLGVARGDRVALVLDGSAEYLVAYTGIVRAGAAVVPLCPDTRTDTLRHPLTHAGVRAVVIEAKNLRWLAPLGDALPELRAVIVLGEGGEPLPDSIARVAFEEACAGPETCTGGDVDPSGLASILYTSGTTGAPKGVMLAHRNLVANTHQILAYLALSPGDSVGMVLPYYYSYGNSILHTHLAVGGTLVALGSMAFASSVLDGLERFRCTGFSGVPATFARLLQLDDLERRDLSALRYATQAGAAMSAERALAFRGRLPHVRLLVMYGQTEAGARLSYLPPEDLERKAGSIGRAIPGVELRVLDSDGRPVPPGTPGELVARGENVMLGYWQDPEATARTLGPEGMRTGDLAWADEEGFLYVVGRRSEMIKSGAHRIGPQEIEQVLERHPEVAECAVVGRPDALLGEAVVAVVVPRPGTAPDARALLRHCFERLPRFKVPSEVRFATALPRTTTGKVQRLELKNRIAAAPAASIADPPPIALGGPART